MTKLIDKIRNESAISRTKNRLRELRPEYLEIAIAYFQGEITMTQMRNCLNQQAEFANLETQSTSLMYLMNRCLRDAIARKKVKLVVVDEAQS